MPASLAGDPLHIACHLGAEGEVCALLRAGADCDGGNSEFVATVRS